MKRIILSVVVMAFAVVVQAGDAKTGQDSDKPSCCSHKVKTSTEASGGCPSAKASCCSKQTAAKQTQVKQTALLSPKAADTAK